MKNCIIWVALYGVYFYISTIIGNILYNALKINFINDIARVVLPFVFLGITYLVLKLKNKKAEVKIEESKAIVNSLKVIAIIIGAFVITITLLMLYVVILAK